MLAFQSLLLRSVWTVNGAQCTVDAAAIQIDYACHCWSTWNGWPLREWSRAAYECTLYRQSAGGQSAWNWYLMVVSRVYCSLHGERQMAAWTAVKCLYAHTETHARLTHGHPLTFSVHTLIPKADKTIRGINICALWCIGPKYSL